MKRMRTIDKNEELISKKDLLATYSISYGSLYRWKRKGLIPEEWFIKKTVSTGQETFFPKQLICERIALIQSMKADISLDDLAKQLSGENEDNSTLELWTVFGKKNFYFRDIEKIMLTDNSGEIRDITEHIKKFLKGE